MSKIVDTLAQAAVEGVHWYVSGVTASPQSRTLAGEAIAYGGPADAEHPLGRNVGMTNVGPLRLARPGQVVRGVTARGLTWSSNLAHVKMTEDHDRSVVRGYVVALTVTDVNIRATIKATADADGDKAIAEAIDHKRDGFSIDVPNGEVVEAEDGGAPWLMSGDLIAIGQVGLPAFYEGSRIDQVAASAANTPEGNGMTMTEEQRIRLAELRAKQNLTQEEAVELATLATAEEADQATDKPDEPPAPTAPAAPAQAVAASLPSVPSGGNTRPPARTSQAGALDRFVRDIVNGYATRNPQAIVAALTDVTNTGIGADIAMPAWSGELWSGVAHEQEFVPLLNQGSLTNYEGKGWRFTTKPVIQDYAGDKAAVPSGAIGTEPTTYTANRKAVGHDIDRKFYDFPDEAFLRAYVEAVRESWSIETDAEAEAWIIANAVDSGVDVAAGATQVLKAVAKGARKVKRAKMGKATFAIVHDDDYDTLMDLSEQNLPAFLDLFGVAPDRFVSSALAAYANKVVVGTKMAATWRQLPGSPIRVSAQHIANGGIDEGFFGYWAVEQHAANGIQYVDLL